VKLVMGDACASKVDGDIVNVSEINIHTESKNVNNGE
jgi:hypothetical protein